MQYGFTEVLQLIGALGVFLFGMKVMSDALLKLAGGKMRSILAKMTSNNFSVKRNFHKLFFGSRVKTRLGLLLADSSYSPCLGY